MECIDNIRDAQNLSIYRVSLVAEGDSYQLQIDLENGEQVLISIDEGDPVVLAYSPEGNGQAEVAYGNWKPKCLGAPPAQFKLNPSHEAGGFVADRKGGIGISDIRDTGFRLISIGLIGFPVTLERSGDDVLLRFRDDPTQYYISPKIPAFALD